MKKQFLSFFYAFRGIWDAVCTEAHLRFHLTAAFYVLLLSPFFELNAAQYGVLILLIAAVISADLFNTSLETVCDLITKERSCYIRLAKDISAAAVLVFALAATAVAVVFFWNAAAFAAMFKFFAANPILLTALVLSAVIAVFFVALGPREIWDRISKKRKPKG